MRYLNAFLQTLKRLIFPTRGYGASVVHELALKVLASAPSYPAFPYATARSVMGWWRKMKKNGQHASILADKVLEEVTDSFLDPERVEAFESLVKSLDAGGSPLTDADVQRLSQICTLAELEAKELYRARELAGNDLTTTRASG